MYVYTYLFYLFIYLILLIIYFAKFDCKLYNPPRLALALAICGLYIFLIC